MYNSINSFALSYSLSPQILFNDIEWKSNIDIIKKVYQLLEDEQTGHGMDHIHRVLNLALSFSKKEHANDTIVTIIALLHDVDDRKLFGQEHASQLLNAKRILNQTSLDSKTKEIIISELHLIGYSKSLQGLRPKTLEGKIVSDADMCDALGAHGILRTFAYGTKKIVHSLIARFSQQK